MMNLLVLPVILPLIAASLLLAVTAPRVRFMLAVLATLATLGISLFIFTRVITGEILTTQLGDWVAPYGITLVADRLTGLMLVLSGFVTLITVVNSSATLGAVRGRFGHHALLQFLFMGVNMSFLTGDLFNLFVSFEVMLVASYAIVTLGSSLAQLREGLKYVIINLLLSAVFVVACGFAYGILGTLNMAQLSVRSSELGPTPIIAALSLLLGIVFATKSAIFPLAFWLPGTYPAPPPAISAYLGALLTKVGVYSLLRLYTLLFPAEIPVVQPLLLVAAILTMLVGAFGALSQVRWRHLLSFATMGSVGYLVFGLALFNATGFGATIFYLINSIVVIFSLFLIAGYAERLTGFQDMRLGGLLESSPYLAIGFFISALALIGLPPTSGFIGKFALVRAGLETGRPLVTIGVVSVLVASLITLIVMMRVWRWFFWETHELRLANVPTLVSWSTVVGVALVILVTIFSGQIYALALVTGDQLATPSHYIEAVLPEEERP
jgi:multicomponent Na+:H+ antiporter subunit D